MWIYALLKAYHIPSAWSPYTYDVLYPVDIRRATGDKARLNPPNQLCFTVLATLPLYIVYRSPYIFARSTCVHAVAVYTFVHTTYPHGRMGAHTFARDMRTEETDIDTAWRAAVLWYRWFRFERSIFTSPPSGILFSPWGLSANAIVLLYDESPHDSCKYTRK